MTLEFLREGTFAFYRLAEQGPSAALARVLVDAIPDDDAMQALDLERLEAIKRGRSESAAAYFRENASRWHEIRALHVPEREVEEQLLRLLPDDGVGELLDIGTGTGRMLEILGPHASRAVGVDQSREMLSIARTKLEDAALRHCQVRQADMYQLPFSTGSFDAVVVHQVLHFSEDPAEVVAEAGRVLRPGGRLLVVDFAPHGLEALRAEHAHRRLGFSDDEIVHWCGLAGLDCGPVVHLPGDPLTVSIWPAFRAARRAVPVPQLSTTGALS